MNAVAAYAAPLRAVDHVVEMTGEAIKTLKAVAGNEPFFAGHYPGFPIFPGVFVLEAVHQAVRLFVSQGLGLSLHTRLVGIHSVRFLSPLRPGDVLQVDARCTRQGADCLHVESSCWRREASPVAVAQMKLRYSLEP